MEFTPRPGKPGKWNKPKHGKFGIRPLLSRTDTDYVGKNHNWSMWNDIGARRTYKNASWRLAHKNRFRVHKRDWKLPEKHPLDWPTTWPINIVKIAKFNREWLFIAYNDREIITFQSIYWYRVQYFAKQITGIEFMPQTIFIDYRVNDLSANREELLKSINEHIAMLDALMLKVNEADSLAALDIVKASSCMYDAIERLMIPPP